MKRGETRVGGTAEQEATVPPGAFSGFASRVAPFLF